MPALPLLDHPVLRAAATTLTAVAVAAGVVVLPGLDRTADPDPAAAVADARPAPVLVARALDVDRRELVEAAAVELAHELRAVPDTTDETLCARDRLAVSWEVPEGYQHGAYVAPLGPAPGAWDAAVNGVVVCGDSTWAFMGFEARWEGEAWEVTAVPYVQEGDDHAHENLDAGPVTPGTADEHDGPDRAGDHALERAGAAAAGGGMSTPAPQAATAPKTAATVPTSAWLAGLGPIEPYARHEPQLSCSPTAKPGTVQLRDALLGAHPMTRNLGITRACHLGGRSEHKEGRAFDWGAYVSRSNEKAAVDRFVTQALATDADGNRHALARRLGVMYMIWNGRIWSAYRASEGWRPYNGPSPHTDHLHVSLSWDGARGSTSFYRLSLAAKGVFGAVPPGAGPLPAPSGDQPNLATPVHQHPGTSTPAPKESEQKHDREQPAAPAPVLAAPDDASSDRDATRDGRSAEQAHQPGRDSRDDEDDEDDKDRERKAEARSQAEDDDGDTEEDRKGHGGKGGEKGRKSDQGKGKGKGRRGR